MIKESKFDFSYKLLSKAIFDVNQIESTAFKKNCGSHKMCKSFWAF